MTIETKQIGFTIEIDTETIAPADVNVFIYQLLNRLNYEHKITSVTIDEVTVATPKEKDLYELPIGEGQDLK